MDFGQTEICELSQLRVVEIDDLWDSPPKCFECCLAEVQPSLLHSSLDIWTKPAIQFFKLQTGDKEVSIEVYSVVEGISNVYLTVDGGYKLNDLLVNRGYAEYSEESYVSKADNTRRSQAQQNDRANEDWSFDSDLMGYLERETEIAVEPPPRNMCTKEIELKGPFSPLEISIHSLADARSINGLAVDHQSVNSVILDCEPQDLSEKYLVAAAVTISGPRNKLTARQTTLMPNIRGFGPLMALIFCPVMELKRDSAKSRYVSMKTGLGLDSSKRRPLFEDHDMTFNLDVEITKEDIEIVGRLHFPETLC